MPHSEWANDVSCVTISASGRRTKELAYLKAR
jgi:hypothetical protein